MSVLDFAVTQLNKFEKMGLVRLSRKKIKFKSEQPNISTCYDYDFFFLNLSLSLSLSLSLTHTHTHKHTHIHEQEFPEEIECINAVVGKGPNYVKKLQVELETMIIHTSNTVNRAKKELKMCREEKRELNNTSAAFVSKFLPWLRDAKKQQSRIRKLLDIVLQEKVQMVLKTLAPDGTCSFKEVIEQISKFSSLFLESRRKMIKNYVPRPRILWTPSNSVGRSPARIMLRKRLESNCLDLGIEDNHHTKVSKSSFESTKRGLICLPASTLPGLAKWVLRSKGLSPKKDRELIKSAPVVLGGKNRSQMAGLHSIPDVIAREIQSEAKRKIKSGGDTGSLIIGMDSKDDKKKSRRELFPVDHNRM